MSGLRVAIAGATGLVGRTILQVLEERDFPIRELCLLASARSAGSRLPYGDEGVDVRDLDEAAFAGCDVAFFSAGSSVSRRFAPVAARDGALVIDNSSAFRMEAGVPLVVPEVNGDVIPLAWDAAERSDFRGIIANPNCSTIQMVVALQPLHQAFGLQQVIVSTYQSVSGTGARGVRALEQELAGEDPDDSPYPHSIAFNVLPHIDVFDDAGWSGEEHKMINETRKIMRLPDLPVLPTTVRVPVRVGHSETVYARFVSPVTRDAARDVLERARGVVVLDQPEQNIYPLALDAEGRDDVFVGRLRIDPEDPRCLAFWVVADNLRKGAATNAVQIGERALAEGML